MTKVLLPYFFTLIILASVLAPSYLNFVNLNTEIIELVDFNQEEENKGNKSLKDFEVKIYYSENNVVLDICLQKKSSLLFYSQNYFFTLNKLNSPPPEQKNLTT